MLRSELSTILLALILIGTTATLTACGDGSDDGDDSGAGDGGDGDSGDGDSGDGDSGDGDTMTPVGPALCGGVECMEELTVAGVTLIPCCVQEGIDDDGEPVAACGVGQDLKGCEQFGQVGVEDGQCSDERFILDAVEVEVLATGCCKPDNTCGLSVPLASDLGCMSRDSVGLARFIHDEGDSDMFEFFEPADCIYVAETDADAGM